MKKVILVRSEYKGKFDDNAFAFLVHLQLCSPDQFLYDLPVIERIM